MDKNGLNKHILDCLWNKKSATAWIKEANGKDLDTFNIPETQKFQSGVSSHNINCEDRKSLDGGTKAANQRTYEGLKTEDTTDREEMKF